MAGTAEPEHLTTPEGNSTDGLDHGLTWSLTLFPLVISAQHSMVAGMANRDLSTGAVGQAHLPAASSPIPTPMPLRHPCPLTTLENTSG